MNLPNIPGYEFETLLGEGCCGAAYRCRYEGGGYRAVKILNGMAVNPGLLNHALTTISRLPQHPNLAPIHTYNLGQAPYFWITDYFAGPPPESSSIRRLAGKLRPNQAWNLIEQLCGAIAFLHKYDVVHTAIKPSNVFVLEEGDHSLRLRLGDFAQGLVAGLHYFELKDSGFFASPEQLADGDFSHGKGKRWDVYSFGVLSYFLLTGQLPRLQLRFAAHTQGAHPKRGPSALRREDPRDYFHAIQQEARYQWPSHPKNDYESKLRSVIDRCLRLDPAERPVDLREVARDFETIRHNADLELLAKQHRAQLRGKTIRIRTLLGTTGIFLISSVLLLISAVIGFSRHMTAVAEISEAEKRRVADLSKQRSVFDEKVKLEVQLRQTAQKESSAAASQISALQRDLKSTKVYTDRFFASLLSLKDFDAPGFQDIRRTELSRAVDYYEAFRNQYQRQPELAAEVARAHQFLGEIKLAQGRLSEAASDLALAREAMDRLLKNPGAEPALVRQAALTDRTLAEIEHQRGNWSRMRECLERSNQRFQQLSHREGEAEATGTELLTNAFELAQLDAAEGKSEQALGAFETLSRSLTSLREKNPGDHAAKSLQARCGIEAGTLLRRQKKEEPARAKFHEAATLLAELIQAESNVEDHQYYLALTLNHIGELEGDASVLLDAHKLLDRITRLNPDDHRFRFELARSYGKLASIQRQETQADQAQQLNTRALDLLNALVKEEPAVSGYQYHLAVQNLELARLLGDTQKFKEAAACVDEALQTFQGLVDRDGANNEYLTTFAKALGHAGFVHKALGDKNKAKEHFESARDTWKQVLQQLPEDREATAGLAWIEDQLSRA